MPCSGLFVLKPPCVPFTYSLLFYLTEATDWFVDGPDKLSCPMCIDSEYLSSNNKAVLSVCLKAHFTILFDEEEGGRVEFCLIPDFILTVTMVELTFPQQ